MPVYVRDEASFVALIDSLGAGETTIDEIVEVGGLEIPDWPRFELHIDGEDLSGGLPTRYLPVFQETQGAVRRLYARCYEQRNLTRAERAQLELVIWLAPGTTNGLVELRKIIENLTRDMPEQKKVWVIIVLVSLLGTSWVADSWVHELGLTERSKEETARLQIVENLASEMAEAHRDARRVHETLIQKMAPGDQWIVNEDLVIREAKPRKR